jgi:type I restriction enzyme S subunit
MSEWRRATIAEVASQEAHALATRPFGSAISAKNFVEKGVPVIRGSNLSLDVGVRLNGDGLAFLTEAKAAEFKRSLARRGDLVFTCWGTVGQIGLIDGRAKYDEYVVSNNKMKLTPDPAKADSTFLYYLLSSPDLVRSVTGQAIGAAVPGFNLGQLKDIVVSLPSLSVQMRIAHVLNAIDDLIANNRRRVEVLEELARAIYRDWYLRFRYPGHEAVPLVDSGIGPIPDGWEVRTLGDVSRNLDRFRKPLSKMQRDQRRGTFPYYGAAKLLDLIDDWIFDASTSSSQRMEAWRRPWATQCCR